MILEQLTVNNFRVFHGEHTFDLSPRIKHNKKRPIILFGGLNGAGKTTTLTAVRLALYGKQSLGNNITTKEYNDYLDKSIFNPKNKRVEKPNTSCVALTFNYSTMGVTKQYLVKRNWIISGKQLNESLTISEDGQLLSDLNVEQCQGFLNELIPIGVSDLFFFDGEKIKELAEDTKGNVLGDSIKKLLGLDLLETLNADLGILLRNEAKKSSFTKQKKIVTDLEKQLSNLKELARCELNVYEYSKPKEIESIRTITHLENELSARGGAWAATREEAIKEQTALMEERRMLESQLRELISDSFPFALSTDIIERTLKQLRAEAEAKRRSNVKDIIEGYLDSVDIKLQSLLKKSDAQKASTAIRSEFICLISESSSIDIIHDISDRLLGKVENILNSALTTQLQQLSELSERLDTVMSLLDRAGTRIARAPQRDHISPLIDKIKTEHKTLTRAHSEQKIALENHKRILGEAITIARRLEKETANLVSDEAKHRILSYATNSRSLLMDFSDEMAKRKIHDLESEFIQSFHRLSRKDDVNLHACIDPVDFSVTLHRENGSKVEKDELSAGEKQIYAISILESLAKTSGRHLPIIIDTPLGRLDSIHRRKLVKQYFPNASHQVIILSTDTEVDETFYKELSPNISHAFKLEYSEKLGSTSASENYFWRQKKATAS